MKRENLLTILILLGLALGVVVGQFYLYNPALPAEARAAAVQSWAALGDLVFIRPLMMIIVPLVFASVLTGVTSIGSPEKLGVIGGLTILYFLATTIVAVLLGLVLVNIIRPGEGVPIDALAAKSAFESSVAGKITSAPSNVGGSFFYLLRQLIPDNPLRSAVERDIIGVVMFGILLGLALLMTGAAARPVIAFTEGLYAATLKLVMWIIWIAPLGVFLIVAARVGEMGLQNLVGPMARYMATVVAGLAIYLFLILPAILAFFARTNPYRFLWNLRKVIATAFSTASSNATLPVTLEECVSQAGCSRRAVNFVIPLGSTINQNGTALYEAVAVSFLFQMFNYDLTLAQQFLILLTATLAAIGAAGIPSAGLVTMAIVIGAVNSNIKSIAPDAQELPLWTIGIIFGVDRVLDMCRTVVNVIGDAIGARIITRYAPD